MDKNVIHRWSNPDTILVATNLADRPALMLHSISQAKASGAQVLLVHVIRPAYLSANSEEGVPFVLPSPTVHEVRAKLKDLACEYQQNGIPCEPIALKGLPAEEIPALVKDRSVDRVLVATRNADGVARLIEGSVAEDVMTGVDVPVCVIGRHVRAPNHDSPGSARILFATSLKPGCEEAAHFACKVAEFLQANLTLLHVISGKEGDAERIASEDAVRERLETLLEEEVDLWCKPKITIRHGDPAAEILSETSGHLQDWIILGAPPHSSVARVLNVGVVQNVLAEARCPVITLKHTALLNV
ncbi:MAG TPA: universal stress protein [Acidisarcina sp.]|nr:universal stress protein [Acidisarcina sp.]